MRGWLRALPAAVAALGTGPAPGTELGAVDRAVGAPLAVAPLAPAPGAAAAPAAARAGGGLGAPRAARRGAGGPALAGGATGAQERQWQRGPQLCAAAHLQRGQEGDGGAAAAGAAGGGAGASSPSSSAAGVTTAAPSPPLREAVTYLRCWVRARGCCSSTWGRAAPPAAWPPPPASPPSAGAGTGLKPGCPGSTSGRCSCTSSRASAGQWGPLGPGGMGREGGWPVSPSASPWRGRGNGSCNGCCCRHREPQRGRGDAERSVTGWLMNTSLEPAAAGPLGHHTLP